MSKYQCPIELTCMAPAYEQIRDKIDGHVMHLVTQKIGVEVDKDELIKALKYDRGQFEAGYKAGLSLAGACHCEECEHYTYWGPGRYLCFRQAHENDDSLSQQPSVYPGGFCSYGKRRQSP